MPNIKSAQKRVRSTQRKTTTNRAAKSRLTTLERHYNRHIQNKNKQQATTLLPQLTAAYDKAAKKGTCHKNKANHKKSRHTQALNTLT